MTRSEAAGVAADIEIAFDGERVLLDSEDVSEEIRSPEISALASRVSVHPGVREAMVMRQRDMISRGPVRGRGPGHRHRRQPRLAAQGVPRRR